VPAALAGDRSEALDQGATDAPAAEGPVDGELVDEHLRPLVPMGHLDPAHEAGRAAILVDDEKVMTVVAEEGPGRGGARRPSKRCEAAST